MQKAAWFVFRVLFLVVLIVAACATVKTVATTCVATSLQSQDILNQLGKPTAALAIAGIDGLKFAECVVASEIDAYIGAHQDDAGARALADVDPLDSLRLANAKAWRAAHP